DRITAASAFKPNASSNSIAAESTVANGLAMSLPAACGYEPWIGSKRDVCKPMDDEGINPMDPEITEASSVNMSPNRFSVMITSYDEGHCTNRIATASTNS